MKREGNIWGAEREGEMSCSLGNTEREVEGKERGEKISPFTPFLASVALIAEDTLTTVLRDLAHHRYKREMGGQEEGVYDIFLTTRKDIRYARGLSAYTGHLH